MQKDKQSSFNPNKGYHNMKNDKIEANEIPIKKSIKQVFKSIWQDNPIFNKKADRLKDFNNRYCKNMVNTEYEIDLQTLEKLKKKIQINKIPGQDRIIGFCF